MFSAKIIAFLTLAIVGQVSKHKVVTCWMPSGATIQAGLEAGFNRDISALFNVGYQHTVDSVSRCVFGPPAKEQIFQATRDGDLNQTTTMAETSPAVVEATNELGETPLHLAAAKGDAPLVRVLLSKGSSVNKGDLKDVTPLMKASIAGDIETVDELLKAGADAQVQALNGSTALMFAAWAGHEAVVARLIEIGCGVDTQKDDGITALMLAAREGRLEVARVLIGANASINLVKKDGFSALMLAAHNGHQPTVTFLLESGANVQLKQNEGHNAKALAQRNGYRPIANILNEVMALQERAKLKESKEQQFKHRLQSLLSMLSNEEKMRYVDRIRRVATMPPDSIYKKSCRDIAVVDDVLTASCSKDDHSYQTSSLKLPCPEIIDNVDGHLRCTTYEARALRVMPDGPYQYSCSDCKVEDGVLSCRCNKFQQYRSTPDKVSASLQLPCKGQVENRQGELKCE